MQKIFSNKLARIVSTIFVPPSFTIIIFSIFSLSLESLLIKKIIMMIVAFAFGFISPIILFLALRKKGKLIDIDASIKEERTMPFLIATMFYIVGFFILIYFKINLISTAFWFCYISNTVIIVFINKVWKISVHAMGAAGPTAALVYVFGFIGFILVPVLILIGWSRVKLKCHTPTQVVAGALFGFSSTYLQLFLFSKFFHIA